MMCRRIVINGRVWEGDASWRWVDEVLLLPLQAAVERLGASRRWVIYPQQLEIEKDGKTLTLEIGAAAAWLQDERISLDCPVYLDNNAVMVPVSLLCRFFKLSWALVEDAGAAVLSRAEPALIGKTVLLDPGHGGEDPGIISGDLIEAEFTWDVAWRLGSLLRLSGAAAAFTRQREETASLIQRTAAAETAKPDLLISIHCNSFIHPGRNGLETYWYSSWPARQLAEYIHRETIEEVEIPDRGVKESAFYVLRHAPTVSVLVKLGFATGDRDGHILMDRWLRERAALGIFRGIRAFMEAGAIQM
ncbi:MAG: hypothetical protein GX341_01460 [Firmicutes bacterium]|jgi:N-acetylmuramoyl-L-alanine amidase|nr:hypothetical protein [Bacillota bacterium]